MIKEELGFLRGVTGMLMVAATAFALFMTFHIGINMAAPEAFNHAQAKPGNACDIAIKNTKVDFAPTGWQIECADSLDNKKRSKDSKNGRILGLTYSGSYKVIQISREAPKNALAHVIVHEWVHAYGAEHNIEDTESWNKWIKYLKSQDGIITGSEYLDDPGEILADNAASCYAGGDFNLTGVAPIPCGHIWALFPEFKPKG